MGEIIKIIEAFPLICEYIVPGMVSVIIYRKLTPDNKRSVDTIFYIYSVIISVIAGAAVRLCFPNASSMLALIVSVIGCAVVSIIISIAKESRIFQNIFRRFFTKSLNDNIWASLLDFDAGSWLKIYLKDGGVAEGYIREIEEKGNESWIALNEFDCKHGNASEKYENYSKNDNGEFVSYMLIRVSDIDRAIIINNKR